MTSPGKRLLYNRRHRRNAKKRHEVRRGYGRSDGVSRHMAASGRTGSVYKKRTKKLPAGTGEIAYYPRRTASAGIHSITNDRP